MWRAALVGLLVTASACGKKGTDEAPAAVAGAPAGTVVAVDGKVTVGDRTLAKGDTIRAEDEVTTADGASVEIELAHNHAHWSMRGGKHGKARESKSWAMAKVEGPAAGVGETATSAGRDGERSAADTDITQTVKTESAAKRPAEVAPAAPPPPPPVPQPNVSRGGKSAPPAAVGGLAEGAPGGGESAGAPRMSRSPVTMQSRAMQILRNDVELAKCVTADFELTVECTDGTCKAVAPANACLAERVGKLGLPRGTYKVTQTITAPAR